MIDQFTGDGHTVSFALTATPIPGTEFVFENGLFQSSPGDYSVSGLTLTFVLAPPNGSTVVAIYTQAGAPPISPSDLRLTDLATVKSYANITDTNSDAVLSLLIPSESAQFLTEIRRASLTSAVYTETRDGQGNDSMQLLNYPVTGINSLSINGNAVGASIGWNSQGYTFSAPGQVKLVCLDFCRGRQNIVINYTAGYPPIGVTAELDTIPAAAPYVIQVQRPNWLSDSGMTFFVGGAALTLSTGAPSAGQYFVQGGGSYLFNSADSGKQVLISYIAQGIPFDIVQAVNEMVLLRYRERSSIGSNSTNLGNGQVVNFTRTDYPKDVWRTISNYKRKFALSGF